MLCSQKTDIISKIPRFIKQNEKSAPIANCKNISTKKVNVFLMFFSVFDVSYMVFHYSAIKLKT